MHIPVVQIVWPEASGAADWRDCAVCGAFGKVYSKGRAEDESSIGDS